MRDLKKPDYWKALTPSLTIEGNKSKAPSIKFEDSDLTRITNQVFRDGFICEKSMIPNHIIKPLEQGLISLEEARLPAVFIYLYDEAWQVFEHLSPLVSQFLGEKFKLLPNFWAWNIPLKAGASGWPAHIDCQADTRFKIAADEEILMSLSLWIPLSNATQENGCIHVLPRSKELAYALPIKDPSEINPLDGLALPAPAGSILGWPQDLWHWGGRVSDKATHPRMSLSLEFQNPAFDPLAEPLLEIVKPPNFDGRLQIIRKQFSKYKHMEFIEFDINEISP